VSSDSVVVMTTGDPFWEQALVSFFGTLGALGVAYVIYRLTRNDEDKRLTRVLDNERIQRREERAFLAMQEIRASLSALGPVIAQRNSMFFPGRDGGPSIGDMVDDLRHVVHLQHIHLQGEERDACGRLYAVTTDWQKAEAGNQWRAWTDDLNDFLDGMARYFSARIKDEPATMPDKPSWSQGQQRP
jgi:hypothetical protein